MQVFERPLLESERRWLRQAAERPRMARQRFARASIPAALAVVGPLAALTLAVSKTDWRLVLAVWAAIGVCIGLGGYLQERGRMARSARRFARALERNKARVTRIESNAVAEIEEEDDEGKAYAFQLPERKIALVAGHDFHESARFPNSDFEVVEILGDSDAVMGTLVKKRGKKLAPLQKISARKARQFAWPVRPQIIDGTLNELEHLLSNPRGS